MNRAQTLREDSEAENDKRTVNTRILSSDVTCYVYSFSAQVTALVDWLPVLMTYTKRKLIYRRALGRAHVPPTKLFPRLAVNKTNLKPRLAAATGPHAMPIRGIFPT